MTAGEIEAVLDFRRGERVSDRTRHKCFDCGQRHEEVEWVDEDSETGEVLYMCTVCQAKEDMAVLKAKGLPVECIVVFDGKQLPEPHRLHPSWYTSNAYGTLMSDGRIFWHDKQVFPESYERV